MRSYLELTMQQAPSENGDICGLFNEELLLRIPFEHVSDQIRIDLAILLDPPSMRGNWRMLAHHLDFEPTYIRVGELVPRRHVLQEDMVQHGSVKNSSDTVNLFFFYF